MAGKSQLALFTSLLLIAGATWSMGSSGDSAGDGFSPRTGLAIFGLIALSLLAKAWAIVLPALFLVLDVWPLRRLEHGADLSMESTPLSKLKRFSLLVVEKLPWFVLIGIFVRIAGWAQGAVPETKLPLGEHTVAERIAQAFHGLAYYPLKTLLPVGLLPIRDLPAELSFREARFLVPTIAVVGLTILLLRLRKRFPALLASWACYVLILSPVLGLAQSGPQLVADRYSYLSCLPIALYAGSLVLWSYRLTSSGRLVLGAGVAVAILVLSFLASGLAQRWSSSESLWSYAYERNPRSPLTCQNLGLAKERLAGRAERPEQRLALLEEALKRYREAVELAPSAALLANEVSVLFQLSAIDPSRREERLEEAIEAGWKAVESAKEKGAKVAECQANLALCLSEAGRLSDATALLNEALRSDPDNFPVLYNLGSLWLRNGRPDLAVPHLQRATAVCTDSVAAWLNLGLACAGLGRKDEAIAAFEQVLRRQPSHPVAARRLAELRGT